MCSLRCRENIVFLVIIFDQFVSTHLQIRPNLLLSALSVRGVPRSHLPTNVGDKNVCRQAVNQNMPSGSVLGRWAPLTSLTIAVIGRPSSIGLQFSETSANVADVFYRRRYLSATFLCVDDKCRRHLLANVNRR